MNISALLDPFILHIKPTFLVNKRATHVKNELFLGDVVDGLIIVVVQG